MKESGGPMRLGGRVGQGAVVLALLMLAAPVAVAEKTDVVVLDSGERIIPPHCAGWRCWGGSIGSKVVTTLRNPCS